MKGQCEMNDDIIFALVNQIAKVPMTKSAAYRYLGMSRTTFDYKVKTGELPRGVKEQGRNGLIWYRQDLDSYKEKFLK